MYERPKKDTWIDVRNDSCDNAHAYSDVCLCTFARTTSSSISLANLKDEMTLKGRGPISLYYESLYGI